MLETFNLFKFLRNSQKEKQIIMIIKNGTFSRDEKFRHKIFLEHPLILWKLLEQKWIKMN